jgi:hypothetical protein
MSMSNPDDEDEDIPTRDEDDEDEDEDEDEEGDDEPTARELAKARREKERKRKERHEKDERNPRFQAVRQPMPRFEGLKNTAPDFQNVFAQLFQALDTITYKQELLLERLARHEDHIEDIKSDVEYLSDQEEDRELEDDDDDYDEDEDDDGPSKDAMDAPVNGAPAVPREGFWGMIDAIPEPVQAMLAPYVLQFAEDFPKCLLASRGNVVGALQMVLAKWGKEAKAAAAAEEAAAAAAAAGAGPANPAAE